MSFPSSSCLKSILKTLAVLALFALCSLLIAYFAREPILTTITDIWVVDAERIPADVVVVLGGGANTRTFAAAEAYKDGLVKKVLIPDVLTTPIEKMGLKKTETQTCKEVIIERGVPESAIELFGTQVSSTWEEAQALKAWCALNQTDVILIPTEFPMTRRLKWVMDTVLGDTSTQIHVFPIDGLLYERDNWWSNEYGLINFQNELIKYAFYRVKY